MIDPAMIGSATITSSKLATSDPQNRNQTEAFIRIQRAANGRLVQIARKEGDQFTTWLCKDDEDLFDTIKQALADMKV